MKNYNHKSTILIKWPVESLRIPLFSLYDNILKFVFQNTILYFIVKEIFFAYEFSSVNLRINVGRLCYGS